jgi:hypothetical protein
LLPLLTILPLLLLSVVVVVPVVVLALVLGPCQASSKKASSRRTASLQEAEEKVGELCGEQGGERVAGVWEKGRIGGWREVVHATECRF